MTAERDFYFAPEDASEIDHMISEGFRALAEEEAWWLSLDADPKYLEWLEEQDRQISAMVHGQEELELCPA